MSAQFWQRLNYFFGLLLIWPLFALIVMASNLEIRDLDLWLHLKMGEVILQKGYVPAVDVLSATIAGKPWINHEWLFQVIAYTFYQGGGAEALIAMQVVVVTVSFLILLFLCYNRNKQLLAVFLLASVLLVYQSRLTIRPDIFSFLFLSIYLAVLAWHTDKRWAVYVLFIVQVLWSNIHGFFFLGPLLVVLTLFAEWVKRRRVRLPYSWNAVGRLSDEEYSRLKKILGIVILASLLNPLTFAGAWYPVGVLFDISGPSRIFFDHIQELQLPITWDTLFSTDRLYYKVLILFSLFSFFLNRRKIDIADLMLWAVFLLFSLGAVRNLVFFAFVACLVTTANLLNISVEDVAPLRFSQEKFRHMTAIVVKLMFIIWILQYMGRLSYHGYFDFDRYERKSEFGGVTQRSYPDKAVRFLKDNRIQGRFFNDFNSGAYLVGQVYPDIKVFIDGRTEVYGPEFFRQYLKIWKEGNAEIFEKAVDKYGLTGALLNSTPSAIPDEILRYLYQNPEWIMVYFDYDAVIFLKDISRNRRWIGQFAVDLENREVPEAELARIGSRKVIPYRYMNRAYTLETLDLNDEALAELEEATRIAPHYIAPYKLRGKIYAKKEDDRKSFENFRIAAMFSPTIPNKLNLASAYENIGDLDHALHQVRGVIEREPRSAKAYFYMARIYARAGRAQAALDALQEALARDPDNVTDRLVIERALNIDSNSVSP